MSPAPSWTSGWPRKMPPEMAEAPTAITIFGCRDRLVGLDQGQFHVLADRAGDDDAVGMAGRGDELDAESAHVENDGAEDVQIGLGRAVTAGADLAKLERAAEEAEHLLLERPGELERLAAPKDQVVARSRSEPVVLGVADRSFRAGVDASVQNRQRPRSSRSPLTVAGDGVGRARLDARLASVRTPRLVQHGQAAEAVGERGRLAAPDRRSSDGPGGDAPG